MFEGYKLFNFVGPMMDFAFLYRLEWDIQNFDMYGCKYACHIHNVGYICFRKQFLINRLYKISINNTKNKFLSTIHENSMSTVQT